MSDRSGSRWEPGPDEQVTQRLDAARPADVVPGLVEQPAAPARRRFGRGAAIAALLVTATLAGGAVGLAVVGDRAAPAGDVAEQAVPQPAPTVTASPDDGPQSGDDEGSADDGEFDDGMADDGRPDFVDGRGDDEGPGAWLPGGHRGPGGDGFGGHR